MFKLTKKTYKSALNGVSLKSSKTYLTMLLLVGSQAVYADGYDDFTKASDTACKNMKLCLSQDVSIPPEMRSMVLMQAEGICTQMRLPRDYAQAQGFGPNHELITSATKCLNAMAI